jgi:hypothetical protein
MLQANSHSGHNQLCMFWGGRSYCAGPLQDGGLSGDLAVQETNSTYSCDER